MDNIFARLIQPKLSLKGQSQNHGGLPDIFFFIILDKELGYEDILFFFFTSSLIS